MQLKLSAIFIIALFLLFTNSASFTQQSYKDGAISDCGTWQGLRTFLLRTTANNGHTLKVTETIGSINTMIFVNSSSSLNIEGTNAINFNVSGSYMSCPVPESGTPIYSVPFQPSSGASCVYGSVSSENGCTFYTWYSNNTMTVKHSGYYRMDTKVNIYDDRFDCCWISDFDLKFEVKARNSSGNSRYLYGITSDLYTGSWRNSCWNSWVEYTTVSNTGNLVYLNKGEVVHVDVSVRNCKNGWTSGSMPIDIESAYYFDHY